MDAHLPLELEGAVFDGVEDAFGCIRVPRRDVGIEQTTEIGVVAKPYSFRKIPPVQTIGLRDLTDGAHLEIKRTDTISDGELSTPLPRLLNPLSPCLHGFSF
jgi:hypothetical protein